MNNIRQIADELYNSKNEYISVSDASLSVNAVVTGSESKETIEALAAVLVQIHHAQRADVVSVVRCSECEHFYPFFDPPYGKCSRRHHDDEVVKYTDFCSYAKKKVPLPEYDDHTVSGLLDD